MAAMEGIMASRSLERLTEAMDFLLMDQCFVKVRDSNTRKFCSWASGTKKIKTQGPISARCRKLSRIPGATPEHDQSFPSTVSVDGSGMAASWGVRLSKFASAVITFVSPILTIDVQRLGR
jgi:hypothetical protein